LSEPAEAIRGITGTAVLPGTVAAVYHAFQPGIDFELDPGRNSVAWLDGGLRPEDASNFYVDYLRSGVDPPITDVNVGSVTRVVAEAIAREIAFVYRQIALAYESGFVDTATGTSLDLVVAILGLTRRGASSAAGIVTFFRAEGDGTISIPQGFEVRTKDGAVAFETTEPRTMQRGQARVDVPVRAATGFEGDAGKVAAGAINDMTQPIEGIDHVANVAPTVLGAEDESDEDLRRRAKSALRAAGKGTLAALELAVSEQATLLEVWDPASAAKPSAPGTVSLLVEAEPEALPGVRARVDETRAAGVLATVVARYVWFKPRLVVRVAPGLPGAGKEKVQAEVVAALQAIVDALGAGEPAAGEALKSAVTSIDKVEEATFADVMSWRSDVVRPGAAALVDAIVATSEAAAGDAGVLRTSLTQLLSEEAPPPPTEARIPDRSLVTGPSGAPATADEIAAATFSVVTPSDGTWWVALDLQPSDVVVTEGP
ncbi:MAG TPA: baseplate J/gp47 family protein, partial [Actinomycetota bacterium]|nr:baseplate J/gp47 family protein [Actinomycetota bacterium]